MQGSRRRDRFQLRSGPRRRPKLTVTGHDASEVFAAMAVTTDSTSTHPHRSLSADAALMLATKGLVGILNVAASILVARTFGPSGQGTVAVAVALALILIQMGSLGLVTSNPALSARDSSVVPSLFANTLFLSACIGTLIVAAGTAARALAPGLLPTLSTTDLAVVLGVVPFALAGQLLRSILLGEGRTVAYNASELALSVGTLTAVTVGIIVLDAGLTGAIILLLIQYPLGLVLYSALLATGSGWSLRPDPALGREMLRLALRVYPATVLAYLLIKVDLLLVDGFLGPSQAGYYSAALVIAQGLFLVPMVVGLNLFPRVARTGGTEQTAMVFRTMAVFFGAGCVVVAVAASPLIHLVFGSGFADAVPLLLWLLPGTFCLGLVNIFSYHFAAREYPLRLIVYWAIGLTLNLGSNILLLSRYGTVVAPVASSVSYALVLFLHARLFARASGGWTPLRPRFRESILTFGALVRRVHR